MPVPDLSIIVPVFDEQDTVPIFVGTMTPILDDLDLSWEIVFVDDGSRDGTVAAVSEAAISDFRVKLVRLSRNFGKEAAMTAGLDAAGGAAVIPMDVDLQDPPELVAEFVRLWREGYDVVYGQRVARDSDTGAKRGSAGAFYRLFNAMSPMKIEPNVGDFRLMSRPVVEATKRLRERNRFMKGLFAWVGYKRTAVPYERPERSAGETKFNYWKLWNFALDGLTSFSTVPLRVWTYIGAAVAGIAVLYTMIIIFQALVFGIETPGYASLMTVVLLLGAVQLVSLGIIGEYLGRLYVESKQRPIYLISESIGFDEDHAAAPALAAAETAPAGLETVS